MKKFILTLVLSLMLSTGAFAANVIPTEVNPDPINTFGVYQVDHSIVIYAEPDEKSPIKQKIVWNSENVIPQNYTLKDLFVIYIKGKDLALMPVTDEMEDWVEVIYDSSSGERGWIKKDDPYKFNTWLNFYNMYGKKYGLKILKGTPEKIYNLYGTPDDTAKKISTITHPEIINLNVIRGNWMLVTVMDADRTPKTGFIRWRSDDGVKFLFPDIK